MGKSKTEIGFTKQTYFCGQRTQDLFNVTPNNWDVAIQDKILPAHNVAVCLKEGHDTAAMGLQFSAALQMKANLRASLPIRAFGAEQADDIYSAEIMYHPNGAVYTVSMVCSKASDRGISSIELEFGVYTPGMGGMDLHEQLIDMVQYSSSPMTECSANHTRMTPAEQETYRRLALKPLQFSVLLLANGGLCPRCMSKMHEIYKTAHEEVVPTVKWRPPRPLPADDRPLDFKDVPAWKKAASERLVEETVKSHPMTPPFTLEYWDSLEPSVPEHGKILFARLKKKKLSGADLTKTEMTWLKMVEIGMLTDEVVTPTTGPIPGSTPKLPGPMLAERPIPF